MDDTPAFDEAWYLEAYTDVAAAVKRGDFPNGLSHFGSFGRAEGRSPVRFSTPVPCDPTKPLRRYTVQELDGFVAAVDAAGGLHSAEAQELFDRFALRFGTHVDRNLDPYSEAYVSAQVALYEEISGRTLDQSVNELTEFDLEAYVNAANPYRWREPSNLVVHHLRIGQAVRLATLPSAPRVLDLGAGWGLTSEFFAMLGADVVAVDINPDFVALINRRAVRLQLPLRAVAGSFEAFPVEGRFDMAFFYEALHHAVRPWQVIARCADRLSAAGVIAFAAEPIQDAWWSHWGLRLDGVSIYCVRKFGWFESGWSEAFARDMFRRVGLALTLAPDAESGGGMTGVARPRSSVMTNIELAARWLSAGWSPEQDAFCSAGEAVIDVPSDVEATHLGMHVVNYRARPVGLTVLNAAGKILHTNTIPSGRSELVLPIIPAERHLILHSDAWVPADEYDTVDHRTISFSLERLVVRHPLNGDGLTTS